MFFDTDVSDIVLPLEKDKHLLGRSENAFPRLRVLLGSNLGAWQQEARYREANGLLILNGAPPSGMFACGWRRPLRFLRAGVDAMEEIVAADYWPVPTYDDILFYV